MRWVANIVVLMALLSGQPAVSAPVDPSAEVQASLSAAQVQRINLIMRREMQERRIVGAALAVLRDGRVLHAQGYGLADVEAGAPTTADTRFMIASMTKMFVATAAMLLVEEGKLSLDRRIGDVLLTITPPWRNVSVRQLLTHTSGIPSFTDFDVFPCPQRKPEADYVMGDVLQEVACLPLQFRPGSDFGYSETNYHLLAMLLEQVGGRPYETFMLERVLRPLGMNSTGLMRRPGEPDRRAVGYASKDGRIQRAPELYPMVELGLVSTVYDLARFDQALANGKLLPKRVLDRLWTPAGIGSANYGMGFSTRAIDGRPQVGHTGGGPAGATSFARFLDDNLTVVLLTNTRQPPTSIQTLVDAVADAVLAADPTTK